MTVEQHRAHIRSVVDEDTDHLSWQHADLSWPVDALLYAIITRSPHARLIYYCNQQVWTPKGVGELMIVNRDYCMVLLDGQKATTRFEVSDVVPVELLARKGAAGHDEDH